MKKTFIIVLIVILLFLAFLSYRKNHEEETYDKKVREIAGVEEVIREEEAKESNEATKSTNEGENEGENEDGTENEVDSREGGDMRVNFEKLWELNPDIVAWIYAPGTRINYPVVYSPDDYYLRRDLEGEYNSHGTIYTRGKNFPGSASIIYGHNMRNGTMFGTVDQYFDGLNSGITIFLPKETRHYSFHSAYVEKPYDLEEMFNGFLSEEDVGDYFSYVEDRSGKEVLPESSMITLSTCTPDGKQRLIVNFTYDA